MKTYILIADGSRARLLSRTTEEPQILQLEDWDHEAGRLPEHLTQSDDLGSTVGQGTHHSSMTASNDPKRHSQHVFAKKLAEFLKHDCNLYDQLMVVAAPKFLGDLRKEFDGVVSRKVVAELGKDLTRVSLHDLESHLDLEVDA